MEILGEIREIIYRNELNSYTIASFETTEEETTVVGYLPFINKGDTIKATGNFVEHPEYGMQFKIETFEKTMPESVEGLERYLASGKLKGIGPATAKRMVDRFGKEIVHILRFEPEKLVSIKGITKEKAMEASESFNENWEIWRIVEYLQKYGIGPQSAEKVFKSLGTNTIDLIEENPYLLVDLVQKADFRQIDQIALKLGLDQESSQRVRSGIKYALKVANNNGHCCVIYQNLLQFAHELLGVSEEIVEGSLINLKALKEVVIEDRETHGEWVYLMNSYLAEKNVAEILIALDEYKNVKTISGFEKKLKKIEKSEEKELSEKQKEAVEAIHKHNVCVITGGPGTGKTTIIKTVIELYKQEGLKVVLCAPTGRAAKRMTETTGEEAKTLHRLLEIGKMDTDQMKSMDPDVEVAPLDADIVIVDEVSMVDIFLMNYLVQAIYKGTKLVLVGDSNQLPSVGPGNVLKDIVSSEQITVITLNKIFRQAAQSKIIINSHKVNEGNSFLTGEKNEELLEDFFFIAEKSQEKVLENVVSLSNGRLQKYGNYDFFNNIQVISPTKKGMLGTKELNKYLQSAINPQAENKKERKWLDSVFREGDRIMQVKNNYDIYWEKHEPSLEMGKGVFNGEYGTISNIDENEKRIKIKFDDEKVVWYAFEELEQIEHAYCITVHKAQRK